MAPSLTPPDGSLLDAEALRQLERLSLVHLDAVISGLVGQRAGPYGLRGLEFADYRPYTPGDDLRRIDWNIYARLREVFVKVAPGEAHVGLCLLLDGSASMVAGEPSKLGYAQRLAAMLGAIALLRSDVAQVQMLADGEAWAGATLTSPRLVAGLIAEIAGMPRGTRTDLASSIRAHRRTGADADIVILVTDALIGPEAMSETLAELSASARSSALVHVIDDRERAPTLRGSVQLRDSETGERIVIDVTPAVRQQYTARFDQLVERVARDSAAHGVAYIGAPTSVPPLDLLFEAARRAELVAL